MRKITSLLFCAWVALLSTLSFQPSAAFAQGTAFMYQGRLNDGGSPATGTYDFSFSLYFTNQTGSLAALPITNAAVPVNSGLFTTTLDFGPGIFKGRDYWLQIAVRTNGAVTFTNLTPRQPLLPVPYAIFANSASNLLGTLASTQLSGTLPASAFVGYTNTVTLTNSANLFGGTFSGNGTNLVNLNASQLTGGTVADARLSANVALLNANQTFTGSNILTGVNTFTNFGNSFRGSFFGNGLVGWLVPTGRTVQAVIDTGYMLTNALQVTVKLPASPNLVDIMRISGAGAGGWTVLQNTNQSVIGNFTGYTTNSSWLQSTAANANWSSIASSSDGTKLVAAANGSGNIYNSIDSGKTWFVTSGSGSPNPAQYQAVASSADGIKLVAAINGGFVYTSTNSGANWTARLGSAAFSSVASSADGTRLVAVINNTVTPGGIYSSTDSGATWAQTSTSTRAWYSVASSANGSNLVAVVAGGGIYTSSGGSWSATSALTKNWFSVASSADGTKLAAVEISGGIYTSVDSGANWVQQTNAPALTWASIASSSDGSKLVAASQNGGIYTSINFGATWTLQNGTTGKTWNCVASSASGGTLAAGVFGAGLYYNQATLQNSTTPGASGGISGTQGSAVELQYIGNNMFMPVSSVGIIWAN